MSPRHLEDEAALSRLVDLYARAVDRGDMALLASLFTPGATLDFGTMFAGGYEAFIAMLTTTMAGMRTHHFMGNRLYAIEGDRAEGEIYSLNTHVIPADAGMHDHIGAGRYLDRYHRTADGWRFVHRTRVLDWTNAGSAMAGAIIGARDDGDPSTSLPLLAMLRPFPSDVEPR